MTVDARGTLDRAGDGWQLTFTRRLAHPPERVWRAITEPEHLAAWFPADIEGERAAGAKLRFVYTGNDLPPDDGEMLAYEPPRLLEFRWGTGVLRFELETDGDGCTLRFTEQFAELGRTARDAAGWHACLDVLEHHLAGEEPPWSQQERWDQVHDAYVDDFGPEAATIGPPDGG